MPAKMSPLVIKVDEDLFVCVECGLITIEEEDIKKHVMVSHIEVVEEHCPICGYVTTEWSDLMHHIETEHDAET